MNFNRSNRLQDKILEMARYGRFDELSHIIKTENENSLYERYNYIMDSYDDIDYNYKNDIIRNDLLKDDYIGTLNEIKSKLKSDFYNMLDIVGISNGDIECGDGLYELHMMYKTNQLEDILLSNDIVLHTEKLEKTPKNNILKSGLETYIYKTEYEDIKFRAVECPKCGTLRINNYIRGISNEYICPRCKNIFNTKFKRSNGEVAVENLIRHHKLDFKVEVDILNKYRFDFIITYNNKRYFIEVNGKQHYEPVDYFGGMSAFKKQKKVDEIKRKYAQEHGIYIELDFREHDVDILKDRFYKVFYNKYIMGE